MEVSSILLIPALLVGGFVVLVVMALVLNKPHLFLLFFIISLPLDVFAVKDDLFSISKILGILALTSWLTWSIKNKKKIHIDKAAIYLLVFVIFGFISLLWSVDQYRTIIHFSTFMLIWIFYLMTINLITSTEAINSMMIALVICGVIIALYGYFQLSADMLKHGRLSGVTDNANSTAFWIIATLPGFYYTYKQYHSTIVRGLILCILAGLLYAMLLTGSRGGIASLSAFFLIPFFFKVGKPKILLTVVTVCALIYFIAPDTLWSRFEELHNAGQDIRMGNLWPSGLKVAVRSPLIGHGLGTNAQVIQPLVGLGGGRLQGLPVHCGPLAVAIELGAIGLIFYMLFLLLPIKQAFQRLRTAQTFDKSQGVLYTLNVLLFSALGAIIINWLKTGGMEYSKLLFFYVGLVASASRVSLPLICNNNVLNKETVPVAMQLQHPVIKSLSP